ncbi:MAG TPA: SwmB domain-containing protein, partial [Gaiellaceae bacterium]|nr:SwmB domain-containing protein [Gaiellaceae bacterium]
TLTLANPGAAGSLSANKTITIDTTAPTVTSRTIDGTTLDITYSEPLDPGSTPAGSDFTVKVNGNTDAVDAIAFAGGNTIVRLTVHTAAQYLDTVTVAYTGTAIEDVAGNQAATYTAQTVTNLNPDAAPNTPAPGTPADGTFIDSTTPALSATFSDPDTLDTGKVTFEVCTTSNCSASLGTFDSSSTTLNVGQSGSAAVPGGLDLQTGTTYYWRAKNVDAAASASSFSATRSFTVDTTAPNVTVAAPVAASGSSYQYYDGPSNTLWLNANKAGSFTLEANATDAQSGITKVSFPAMFGTGSNDQASPTSGSNYESAVYSFDGTGSAFSSPGSETITAYNGDTIPAAITATDSLTVDADGSGPAAFSLGGPADGTNVRTGVVVSASPTDAGSGVAAVAFYECDTTLHAGCDPTNTSLFGAQIGATQPTAVAGVYSVAWNNTGLTDGHSYAIAAIATDNVANTTTSSINTVVVDNSAPAVAVAAPTPVTGAAAQYYDAGSKTLFLRAAGQGSFKLETSASDAQTGIASVTFPALLATGSNAGTHTGGSSYESSTYSFDGTGTPISSPGAETITAANGVTLPSAGTASDSITVTADGTPAATNVQFPVDHVGYDGTSWNPGAAANCSGAPAGGNICGTVSDGAGSGVASVVLTIAQTASGTTTYYDGSGFTSSTPVQLTATVAGSNWSYGLDQSKLAAPDSYVVTVHSTDNVGNNEVDQLVHFTYGTDLTPPATTLSLTGASHAYLVQVGTHPAPNAGNDYNLYYSTVNSGGGFTIHAHSTDQTGIADVVFPDLSGTTGFTGSGGTQSNGSANPWDVDSPSAYTFSSAAITAPGQKLVSSVDTVTPTGNTSDNTLTFLLDNSAPTGGVLTVNGTPATSGGASTWATSTSVSVGSRTDFGNDGAGSGVASSLLSVASATLSNGVCGSYGAPTTITGTDVSGISFASGNCYLFTLTGTDHVGNAASLSVTVMIDTTPPSQPTIDFTGLSSGNTFDNGAGTLFFRPSDGGTFTVDANGSTDAESGIKTGNSGYTFSPLSGNLNGTQTGSQLAVAFDHTSSGSNTYTVHSTDNAGLDSSDANFTVTADSTAPSGGALTVNGTAAAGVATSSYLNSGTTVTIDSRTDYTDAGSGLASSTLTVQSATLANDACGAYGSSSTISGTTPQSVSSGHCYLFTLTGADNVGNATSVSTVVMVDTTPPSQPTVSITGLSAGNTFLSGSTLFFRPSAGGTFTVTANGSSDGESGIMPGNAGYTFSSLNASGGANFGVTQTGNQLAVTFDGTTTGPTAGQSVVVNNNAGLGSTPGAFTVTQDSTAPAGGSLSVNPYSSSLTIGISSVAFTDGGSGIASNVITRSDPLAPSGPGSCPATGYVDTGANVVSGATDTVPTDGRCYQYTLTAKDAVGNVASVSTIVLVDTTGPTGGSIQYSDGVSSLDAVSVNWDSGTDAESGISQILVQRAAATLSGSTCGAFSSFSTIITNPASSPISDSTVSVGNCYEYQLVVTNGTGLTTTYGSSSIAEIVNGSPIALAPGASSGAYLAGTTLYLGPGGGTFQLQLTGTGQNGVTTATWQGKGSSGALTSSPAADFAASSAPFISGTYTWSGGGIGDSIQVTRDPTATVDTLNVQSDTTAPTGSITYANGVYGSASVPVTTSASDADSGVATTQVQRAQTTFTGATCDTANWSGFSNVTLAGGVDNTVSGGHCYQYQLVVTDNVGNSATINNANVAEIPDVTPPTFVSASTNATGTQLTVNMSEPLDCTATTPASAFLVTYNGIAQPAPTSLACSGSTITLGLPTSPNNGQTVKTTYTEPAASGDRIRDLAVPSENATTSFGPVTVVNNTTDTTPPVLSSATVDAATLTLAFSEALAGAAPDGSAFTVSVDGHQILVTGAVLSGNVATLTLAQAVASSDTVAVSYAVPALNALHDAATNDVAPFAVTATNQTPIVVPPAGGGAGITAPTLVSASPQDGSTVVSVAAITLNANQSVNWTGMTVARPDGSTTALDPRTGQSETWTFATSTPGLYIVTGTLGAGGQSQSILSHFTIWAPPATSASGTEAVAPPVEKNAVPQLADSLTAADGNTLFSWPMNTFGDAVVIQIAPTAASAVTGIPDGSVVVDVTAFMRSNHAPVTNLGQVADIQFPHAPEGSTPMTSQDAKSWRTITQLPTFNLPAGQTDGWFRDSDGTVHVLTRHLTFYALAVHPAATKLALSILTARRLWIDDRTFVAVRLALTAPARVTGSFVGPNGRKVPGQTIKTPTRHAGITILRVPLHVTKPGVYRLQMHADGIGQVANRTARIAFVKRRPTSPLWQVVRPLRIVVIHGARAGTAGLSSALGRGYLVRTLADSELYTAVDPTSGTAGAAVVVDLGTVPMQTLIGLHALLPEVKIVGLTNDPAVAAYARTIGVDAVLGRSASGAEIAGVIVKALRQS